MNAAAAAIMLMRLVVRLNVSSTGTACERIDADIPSYMSDGFEGGVSPGYWSSVDGGGIGLGCGSLLPVAHGKSLYFNGCGMRQAITAEMDLSRARYVRGGVDFLFS